MTREEFIAGKSHVPGEMRIGDMCANPSQGCVGETALMVGRYCVAVAMPSFAGNAGEVDQAPALTRANAERMVRVWNNHDALVAILTKIVATDDAGYQELEQMGITSDPECRELTEEARAVVRRATQP